MVAFLATIGGLVATQYATAKVQFTLGAKTKTATLQFVAFDSAVDTTYGDYLLQNITGSGTIGTYKLNFGTLAWHYNATWTAAFAIVWTGASAIRIGNCTVLDSSGSDITADGTVELDIQVYLHADPHKTCSGVWGGPTDSTKLKYYDSTAGGSIDRHANGYVLEGLSIFSTTKKGYVTYGSNLYLFMVNTDGTTESSYGCTWDDKGTTGQYYVWASNYTISGANDNGLPVAANIDTTAGSPGANFVWVEIAITPNSNTPASLDGYTISFSILAV